MKLFEKPGYETIIGDGRHLTEYMKNLIKEGKISESEAMSIKDRLKNGFENGSIKEEELILRAHEMFSDFPYDYIWFFGNVMSKDETCPICLEKMDYKEGSCKNCGFDLDLVHLSLKEFEMMDIFADFVDSHEDLKDTKDMLLENDYYGDHLYNDLLLQIFLDDSLKREYDSLHLNNFADLDEMYADFKEDTSEENYSQENAQTTCMDEIEFCKMADNKYRLIPRVDDSYVMPVDLNRFKLYTLVDECNDADFALYDLSFVPWCFRQQLRDLSFEGGFLTHNACKANWQDFSKDLRRWQLKEFLEKHGIDATGNKKHLVQIIAESNLPLEEFVSEKTFLTQESYDYLNEYEWIQFYIDNLYYFDFLDFFDFLDNHNGSIEEISLKYLDEHIKLAEESLDFDYIMRTYESKTRILHSILKLDEALECDIRILHLNMNPICLPNYSFSSHVPLDSENISNLKEAKSKYGEEVIFKSFNKNWNFMGFKSIIIPKNDVWDYLINALNSKDQNHGSKKIREKYFLSF